MSQDARSLILLRGFYPLLCLGEIGCCVFDCRLAVARVEINQRLALLDVVSIFDMHADDGAVDSRAYRIEMAVDFGIISPFIQLHVIPNALPGYAR